MQKMKYSGVEWIGEIPEDWDIKRLKAVLCERNENNNPIKTDYILSLTNDRGVIPYDEKGDVGNKSKEDLSGYKLAYLNDIVLNSMNVIIGSVALSKYYGCVSPVYYMLYPRNPMDDVRYYNYIFQTKEFQSKLKGYGNGIMEIRMRIQMSKLNTVELPTPDATTQMRIADFLDDKCGKIDRYIEKQQKIIDKLKEYKQAVITEAVTKGLNPDVPMKDSGIEWIGMIPEHWKVMRIKNLLKERNERSEDGIEEPLSMSQKLGLIPTKFMDTIPNIASSFIGAKLAYVNDLVFNKLKAHLGVFSVSHYDGLVSPDYAVYYSTGLANLKYLEYTFKTPQCICEFRKKSSGIADGLTRLYTSGLFSIYVPFPCIMEQNSIAKHLETRCSEIDSAISKQTSIIEKLTEYKKSLIYEAVTGKMEV